MLSMLKKIKSIMSKREKKFLFFIFIIILGKAFLDLLGVASIMPLVSLLTVNEEDAFNAINSNVILKIFANAFNIFDPNKLLIIIIISFCVLFLFKALYGLLYTYLVNRFTLNYSRRLTKKLMEKYLSFPYEYHLDNNSSTLIRKSTYDVDLFTMTLNDTINFLVNMITGICILTYLIISDWRIAIIAGFVVILFAVLLVFVLKPKSKKIGKITQELNSYNYKYLSQAFNGIKESKISNKESHFVNEYDSNRANINSLTMKKNMINAIPGQCIELVGMIGICISLLVIMFVTKDTTKTELVNKFAVFAYAIIKLLPSVTSITNEINYLSFYKSSVDSIYDDLTADVDLNEEIDGNEISINPIKFDNELKVNNVSFFYKSIPNKKVLNDVSVKIKKNSSVAFCGSSGAGKTTLIDIILGLLPCREGTVTCDGIDISTNMKGWRANISYIPQNIFLIDDTIRNNVAFGESKENINDDLIWDALEKAQLKDYVINLPNGLDSVIGERGVRMSGGQRQRIGIARAFYRNTNIIVFDEATSALDYETEKNVLEHVSKYSADHTLIIITHRLNTIESCDHIYKVENAKILQLK